MPYAVVRKRNKQMKYQSKEEVTGRPMVIWKRGTNQIEIAGLKPEDLDYLEKIPCLSTRFEGLHEKFDSEGFMRFGPTPNNKHINIKPAVVLTGLEVLGFRVVTTTATTFSDHTKPNSKPITEYSWTLRREFSEPEPQD